MRDPVFAARRPALACLLVAALSPSPAAAQYIGAGPPPLPSAPLAGMREGPGAALSRNLRLLAQNPRNVIALVAAGRAALELEDYQSAAGFFGRAEEVAPSSPEPKIGMGAASVALGDPRGGLIWFAQAQRLGASPVSLGADRGLAHDLLGQQALAQADYRAALSGPMANEARRRLALSLAISRDRAGAIATLQPLLNMRDPAAQRARAFILALGGDRPGARSAIDQAMPGSSARIDPFFMVLPSLSAEQKAAAVHLGVFPTANEMRLVPVEPVQVANVALPPRATPQAGVPQAVAPRASGTSTRPKAAPARSATRLPWDWRGDEVANSRIRARGTRVAANTPAPRAAQPVQPSPAPTSAPVQAAPAPLSVTQAPPSVVFRPAEPVADADAAIGAVLAAQTAAAEAAPAPVVPPPAPAVEPLATVTEAVPEASPVDARQVPASTLAEVGGDRLAGIDTVIAQVSEPPPPAPTPRFERVDEASKARAEKAAAARLESNRKAAEAKKASEAKKTAEAKKQAEAKKLADAKKAAEKKERESLGTAGTNWVQLAGGSREERMTTEYRKLTAKSAALRRRDGYVTQGKDYFRLLVGPFDDKGDAQAFVNLLAREGVDGFSWTRTPATIRIEKLGNK